MNSVGYSKPSVGLTHLACAIKHAEEHKYAKLDFNVEWHLRPDDIKNNRCRLKEREQQPERQPLVRDDGAGTAPVVGQRRWSAAWSTAVVSDGQRESRAQNARRVLANHLFVVCRVV